MSPPIGALRTRIRLERPTLAPDAGGLAWETAGTVWARMDVGSPGFAPRVQFELRMRRDVQRGWRVALGDRRFRINAVRDGDDRGARLWLDCEEEFQ